MDDPTSKASGRQSDLKCEASTTRVILIYGNGPLPLHRSDLCRLYLVVKSVAPLVMLGLEYALNADVIAVTKLGVRSLDGIAAAVGKYHGDGRTSIDHDARRHLDPGRSTSLREPTSPGCPSSRNLLVRQDGAYRPPRKGDQVSPAPQQACQPTRLLGGPGG